MKYTIHDYFVKTLKELPKDEQPRHKLITNGSLYLSDQELLCAMLGSGCKGRPVQDIANDVLKLIEENEEVTVSDLLDIRGLGSAQASVICSSIEFGRRMQKSIRPRYSSSESVFNHIRHYGDRSQEHLICIMFNGALEIITTQVITIGLVNKTMFHPREIFSDAIKNRASAIIIAHNHPAGNLQPSSEDLHATQNLITSGKILGIQVMDHIIFSENNYYSIHEHGDVWFD